MNQLIITSDGSHTIYVPELDEHYHSIHGALQESNYIFIEAGYRHSQANPVNIFEAGLGTGLNALLTALESIRNNRITYYTSIEKYPVEEVLLKNLNYHSSIGEDSKRIFDLIHSSPWNIWVEITNTFHLKKIKGDLTSEQVSGCYDLIYYDAFGPDKQPAMWTAEVFAKIAGITATNGVFVTYSAKGQVKRNLRSNGFRVTMLAGPPGKRQIIRAVKL